MPKIKDMPKIDRPREKFLAKGPDALSKSELLAILIGSGIKGKNVKQLSEQIIRKYSNKFLDLTVDDLLAIQGIGKAKALQIISSLALVKRFYDERKPQENLILTAKDAIALNPDLKEKKKEYLICLFLNARNALLKKETISIGTLDKSLIHPREIFGPAVELRSAGIILLHNHPSGDPAPSEQDKEVFNKIIEAGKIMGVNVLDFIIIGDNKNYSFFKHLQKEKQDFYIADGVQFSLLDLLVDKNNEYANQDSGVPVKNKILDLFAGIGGIKIGFEKAGFECVFSNDFDKDCKITYDLNFAGKQKSMALGDISKISSNIIPDFDILTGGFPCQPFSIAGYRKGFSDNGRGNLFFEIIRILKDKKPKVFLLENVKNLKTHDKGNTIKIIYRELQKLGYKVTDKVLNSMKYGNLPQNRERIYIVGFLDQEAFNNFEFPQKIPLTKTIHDCLENQEVDDKYYYNGKPLYNKLKDDITKKDTVYQWRRKYVRENKNGVCPTLTANMGMGGHNVPLVLNGKGIRKLTPRECANFQGFPKDFKLPNIADSNLYKQFGNSVSVPVIERVAINIKKALS